MSYNLLTNEQKEWILSQSGKDLFAKIQAKRNAHQMTAEESKQIYAFWLNEHNVLGNWSTYELD